MKVLKASAATVLVVAALGAGAGTAHASPPAAVPVADRATAQDNLIRELTIGWEQGGPAAVATGAGVGFAIGCVSIFPNFVAGCIVGTAVGATIGAYNGITGANPNVEPAFYEWLNATP